MCHEEVQVSFPTFSPSEHECFGLLTVSDVLLVKRFSGTLLAYTPPSDEGLLMNGRTNERKTESNLD